MRATSEVLEDRRVRLAVEVDEAEVEAAVSSTAKSLARELRVPGFRPGHVPRQVIEARLGGAKALRGEALRELLPDYYARALSATELEPISPPELSVTTGEEDGPVEFDAVVEVRPQVHVSGYDALRVTIPSPIATDTELDAMLDRLRETDAELAGVSRPIVTGDHITIDVRARDESDTEVASVDDFVYVVGSGSIVDTADDQLVGMKAGEVLEVDGTSPSGPTLSCTITIKDVRERVLPELTDEWVRENTEFETVEQLRDSSLSRIGTAKLNQSRRSMREATFAALASQIADDEVPDSLLDAETRDRLEELEQNLAASKITVDTYLAATRTTVDQLVESLREDARRAIKVDLALRAIAMFEDLDATDDELAAELERLAAQRRQKPQKLRDDLDRAGRMGALRSGISKTKAADWVLERVTYVDETGEEIDRSLLDDDDTTVGGEPLDQSPATTDETTDETEEQP
jgi:trigger factor